VAASPPIGAAFRAGRRRASGPATALLATVAAIVVAIATPAGAHALLRSSSPGDGELLDAPPTQVVLEFTESPDLGLSSIQVLDAQGRDVGSGDPRAGSSGEEVRRALPAGLPEGVYTVSWRVLSKVDGHVTAGAFAFGVGVEPTGVPEGVGGGGGGTVQRPSPLSVAGRWGFYWGLAGLLGAAVAGRYVFRGPPRGLRALGWSAWALAAAGLVLMFLAERSAAGVSAGALLASDRGELLLARGGALAVTGIATALAIRRPRPWLLALGGAAAFTMLVHVWAGHAGASDSWRWLKVGTQWAHIVAVGVWIGGLLWLFAGTRGGEPGEQAAAVRRFSWLAGFALAGVAVTGGARAWSEVGSVGALWDTGFGLTVVGKVALFGGLALVGAYNRYRLVPAIGRDPARVGMLRRTVTAELVLASGVFGLTGIMAGLAPPASVAATSVPRTPQGVVVSGSDFATTVRVRLAVTPGFPGPNAFEVRLRDYDTGEPVPARAVTLRFRHADRPEAGSSELDLRQEEAGVWTAQGTNLSVAGRWDVGVLVEQEADSLQVDLRLETRLPEQEIQVTEGDPTIYQIQLTEGRSVQGYVDPGRAGAINEVHFTFFGADGGEQPIDAVQIMSVAPDGEPSAAEPRELSEGHFVATVDLEPGEWRFEVTAETGDGDALFAYFEETIEEGT